MYHSFTGNFIEKSPTHLAVECQGVGYLLSISLHTYTQLKEQEKGTVLAHMIVREDEIALFGFAEPQERELFKLLITVSGVGPNTARLALSFLSPYELCKAIMNNDLPTIKKIKGIGDKTAQKVLIDLKDKVNKLDFGAVLSEHKNENYTKIKEETLLVLITLQVSRSLAEKAIDKVLSIHGDSISVEDAVKLSLRAI